LCWSSSPCRPEARTANRPFTIKDSIEISQIVNPARSTTIALRGKEPLGVPIYSPDGKYFLVVTQRGLLSSNKLEGTIWLFNWKNVRDHILSNSRADVLPKKLVSVSSTSNTPVIEDVRWIDGSKKIAFLAKDGGPYQQLFVADAETGATVAVTQKDSYVTAYEMRGDVTVYATLAEEKVSRDPTRQVMNVVDRSALGLLYQDPPATEDIEEGYLLKRPNFIHVQEGRREISVTVPGGREPLQVFVPSMSLSPDARFLITLAPITDVPQEWEQYQPRFEQFRLKAGQSHSKDSMTLASFWRPEQYVLINLETGLAFPLLDAPAGRDLGYGTVPTEAFWLPDSRHAILTNTYVPFSAPVKRKGSAEADQGPTVALVDVTTRELQTSVNFRQLSAWARPYSSIDDIGWNATKNELTIRYGLTDDSVPVSEMYVLSSNEWIHSQAAREVESSEPTPPDVELVIHEDLNHPAVLSAHVRRRGTVSRVWDPNPQLAQVEIGKAEIYHWRDVSGRTWSGILVLPPLYDTGRRYPLVIQTHGYDAHSFFVDGAVTTGNGGRALAAKDIIVLQMGDRFPDIDSPQEAPDQLAAFQSAIDLLVAQGMVDRSRVGIIGFSRTCFHVMYALTHAPRLFRAATITDGVNFGYVEYVLMNAEDRYQAEAEGLNGGSPFDDNLMQWIRDAPNFGLTNVKAPLLISSFLKATLLSQWEIYSGLRRLNKPVEMLWWPSENTPHILVQPAQRYVSQQSAVDWFDFWLNDHKDPDPDKAKQYTGWEALRELENEHIR
jgi:dipeptidyl aminopeptidase/acylaminoacyl peptidase